MTSKYSNDTSTTEEDIKNILIDKNDLHVKIYLFKRHGFSSRVTIKELGLSLDESLMHVKRGNLVDRKFLLRLETLLGDKLRYQILSGRGVAENIYTDLELKKISKNDAIQRLTLILNEENLDDKNTRIECIQAIGNLAQGDRKIFKLLESFLISDEDKDVRIIAAKVISNYFPKKGFESLKWSIQNEESVRVKKAFKSILKYSDNEYIKVLKKQLFPEPHKRIVSNITIKNKDDYNYLKSMIRSLIDKIINLIQKYEKSKSDKILEPALVNDFGQLIVNEKLGLEKIGFTFEDDFTNIHADYFQISLSKSRQTNLYNKFFIKNLNRSKMFIYLSEKYDGANKPRVYFQDRVLEKFFKYLRKRYDPIEFWYKKALHLYKEKKHIKTLECINKALEIYPKYRNVLPSYRNAFYIKYIEMLVTKGDILFKLGNYRESLKCYNISSKRNDPIIDRLSVYPYSYQSKVARGFFMKGRIYQILKKYNRALECYDMALGSTILDSTKIRIKICEILDNMERYKEAIEYYYKIFKRDLNPNSIKNFSIFCNKALKGCDITIKNFPGFIQALITKGLILEKLERYEEAIECYENTTKLDQNNKKAWFHKACLKLRINNIKEFLSSLQRAIELDSKYFNLAMNFSDFDGIRESIEYKSFINRYYTSKFQQFHDRLSLVDSNNLNKDLENLIEKEIGRSQFLKVLDFEYSTYGQYHGSFHNDLWILNVGNYNYNYHNYFVVVIEERYLKKKFYFSKSRGNQFVLKHFREYLKKRCEEHNFIF